MAKATLKLNSGATVTFEGTPEEVKGLLQSYSDEFVQRKKKQKLVLPTKKTDTTNESSKEEFNSIELVNAIKDSDEFELIEKNILDRTSYVDRTLLPLYVVHEYFENSFGLTSGQISIITSELGIPIQQPNVSRTLSGTASKYVMGNSSRKRGAPVKYKLSRRGMNYIKNVIEGESNVK